MHGTLRQLNYVKKKGSYAPVICREMMKKIGLKHIILLSDKE